MTSISSGAQPTTPWFSVWLRPRAAIDAVLANDPRRHVLLLAALYWIVTLALQLTELGWTALLLDWRVIAGLVVGGALAGIVSLYISGLFLRWSGLLLGGHASQVELRAVLAWRYLPVIAGLAILLVGLALLATAQVLQQRPSPIVTFGVPAIGFVLGLWQVTVTMLMLARAQGFGFWRTLANFLLGIFLLALLLAVLVRTFLFQPFNMPSGSNEPTLMIGDYIFVSKYPYGYSRYSLPFSPPLFSGRIFGTRPQGGDVVVFRLPRDPSADYVKRIVGFPGDRVQMIQGQLYINGVPVKRERLADVMVDGQRAKTWRETLPNGVSYETLDLADNSFLDNTQVFEVPAGQYFTLGDNRDNSMDSRVRSFGSIPFENLIGRAELVFWSVDPNERRGYPSLRADRIGRRVR